MAELEIHAEEVHATDAVTRGVSVMVAVIGIMLAIVTIASHRAHTASVIHRTEANDQWAFYQAKKIREHMLDIAASMESTVTVTDAQRARELEQSFTRERDRYDREAKEIQRAAQDREAESGREEQRALRLDVGEGFLELGLVLSSLYFLSKRSLFPALGGTAALVGAVISATHWFV